MAQVAKCASFMGRFLSKYALKLKNGNNKHDGKLLELSIGIERMKIGPEIRPWQLFSQDHPKPPRTGKVSDVPKILNL